MRKERLHANELDHGVGRFDSLSKTDSMTLGLVLHDGLSKLTACSWLAATVSQYTAVEKMH